MMAKAPSAFSVDFKVEGKTISASFSGTADLRALDELEAKLTALHAAAVANEVEQARLQFENLEFINSSCFRCFITFLTNVDQLPEAQRYRVTLLSNPAMPWQRRSFSALYAFAPDVVALE